MSAAAIHQMVAGFTVGDAISNHARSLRKVFLKWGYESKVFARRSYIHSTLLGEALDAKFLDPAPTDLVVLHLSIGAEVNEIFRALNCRKVIIYHNITPSHFFEGVNSQLARQLANGRKEAATLKGVADLNLAVSKYNASELVEWGFDNVDVLPLLLDLDRLVGGKLDPRFLQLYDDGVTNVCFIGRVAPNKCIEDLLHAFYYYHKFVNPNSRFLHVGGSSSKIYQNLLESMRFDMDIDAFHFLGGVSEARLRTVFQKSHLFLCMSEHEGFCIPLLEAMKAQLPVLAYAAAAIPETMNGAGVVVKEKNWALIAQMMGRLTEPGPFRDAVIQKQNERLVRYEEQNLEEMMREKFGDLLPG